MVPIDAPAPSPDPAPADACGCSRRDVLAGLAATAAAALTGCSANTDLPTDPPGGADLCGDNLCIDLDDPANAALGTSDGVAVVAAPRDRLIVIRTSPTELTVLSDICTHAGCALRFDRASHVLNCPCHQSRFALDGSVLRGPASRPLRRYQAQIDAETNIVTIVL